MESKIPAMHSISVEKEFSFEVLNINYGWIIISGQSLIITVSSEEKSLGYNYPLQQGLRPLLWCAVVHWFENIENIYCHSLSTIQYNTMLFVYRMYTKSIVFLKDCTWKHVGPIVSYKGF